ncbi:MAG: SCO family protein [Gammaproteobacteria bacterium]|nr:SCO family protein [Gammaproteobacteria bacterium]
MRSGWPLTAAAIIVVVCASLAWLAAHQPARHARGTSRLPAVTLTDDRGRTLALQDIPAPRLLVYFGYTRCPDYCPATLHALGAVLQRLGAAGAGVQPVFITVDPEYDSPARLRRYVSRLHPRLLGLTGSAAAIETVASWFKAAYRSNPADPRYVDHSLFVYLVNRDGRALVALHAGTSVGAMADAIRQRIALP